MSEEPVAVNSVVVETPRWKDEKIAATTKAVEATVAAVTKLAPVSLLNVRYASLKENAAMFWTQASLTAAEVGALTYGFATGKPLEGALGAMAMHVVNLSAEYRNRREQNQEVTQAEKEIRQGLRNPDAPEALPPRPGVQLEDERLATRGAALLAGKIWEICMPTPIAGRKVEGGLGVIQVALSAAETLSAVDLLTRGSGEAAVAYVGARSLNYLVSQVDEVYSPYREKWKKEKEADIKRKEEIENKFEGLAPATEADITSPNKKDFYEHMSISREDREKEKQKIQEYEKLKREGHIDMSSDEPLSEVQVNRAIDANPTHSASVLTSRIDGWRENRQSRQEGMLADSQQGAVETFLTDRNASPTRIGVVDRIRGWWQGLRQPQQEEPAITRNIPLPETGTEAARVLEDNATTLSDEQRQRAFDAFAGTEGTPQRIGDDLREVARRSGGGTNG